MGETGATVLFSHTNLAVLQVRYKCFVFVIPTLLSLRWGLQRIENALKNWTLAFIRNPVLCYSDDIVDSDSFASNVETSDLTQDA